MTGGFRCPPPGPAPRRTDPAFPSPGKPFEPDATRPRARAYRRRYRSPHLGDLTVLDLQHNAVRSPGARALAASGNLHRLSTLRLGYNSLGDEGLRAFAEAGRLRRLTTLELTNCGLTSAAALALAESPHLPNLTDLALNGNRIFDDGLRALLASPRLPSLTRIDLRVTGVTPEVGGWAAPTSAHPGGVCWARRPYNS